MASTKPKKKNPRLASGRKRARQDVKLNAANTSLRSKYRTAVKNVEKAVLAGDKTKAAENFAKAQSVLDTVADKGIFHKNKASRDKGKQYHDYQVANIVRFINWLRTYEGPIGRVETHAATVPAR